jgi:predicted RNA-binding Zn-ribbon protein involved in translation (DUF1610 family)
MAKPIVVSQEGLRVLIDPDDPNRKPKPIVEYKLSPEEIELRYGHIKGTGKAKPIVPGDLERYWNKKEHEEEGEDDMNKIEVDVNEILEVCRIHGTGKEGCAKVAERFGWSLKRAENQVFNKKIRRLLEDEKKQAQNEAAEIVKSAVEEEKAQELKKLTRKLSKVEVIRLKNEGKSLDEIVDYFSAGWNGKLQLLKAKVILYMSDKKLGGPRKIVIDEKKALEQSAINSHEDHPDEIQYPAETEEYPDLNAVKADLKQKVDEVVKESIKKSSLHNEEKCPICGQEILIDIKSNKKCVNYECIYNGPKRTKTGLHNDVDEMMEMVPDCINNPKHYTFGGIETTDFIQAKLTPEEFEGFCKGVILQYISRARLKGGVDDLRKAEWYLSRLIKVKGTA